MFWKGLQNSNEQDRSAKDSKLNYSSTYHHYQGDVAK